MSFWIDVPAETDEERVAAWQRQLAPLVADVFATYSAGFFADYSPESLAELEQFVVAALPDPAVMKEPPALPVVKAAVGYLGETLLRAGGGEWLWGQGKYAGMPCVALEADSAQLAPMEYITEAVRVRDGNQFTRLWSRIEAGHGADSADLLLTLVETIVENHGYSCTIESDEVLLSGNGASDWVLPLDNLRRRVAAQPQDQWPALVADHLSTMFAELDVSATDPLDLDNFERIRPLLRARMYPEDMADVGIPVVARTLAPGLAQRVVIDQVNTIVAVTYDRLSHWQIQEQDLFELAEDNTHDDGLLTVEDLEDEDGERIFGLYGSADYASAHVRWLGAYPVVGHWGAAFVVPCEGTVFIHPLNGTDAYVTVGTLAKMAMVTHAERPSPVSPSVYWWHDGIIELAAEVRESGDELELHVSAEFQEVMEQIAEYADGPG
ncbi:hypothetical protein [Nocardia sp. NBC_01009]|uniref:hypothetical protein n=1 Tax=Nocardia sp. NBC_01009 TaxID=2975996 RepID=UPI00386521D1|nr:hypothetical protein OHA42_19445 [Nocardia sp. NBC_01009]